MERQVPQSTEPVSWYGAAEEVGWGACIVVSQSLSVRPYAGLCPGMGEAINIRTGIHDSLYTKRCSEESEAYGKGESEVMGRAVGPL